MSATHRRAALKPAAFHEAGHIVIGWTQGLSIRPASIDAGDTSAGDVVHAHDAQPIALEVHGPRRRDVVERNVRTALAGELAQRRACPRSERFEHHVKDRMGVAALLVALHGDHQAAIVAHERLLQLETQRLLSTYWHHVESVAAALLERRSLTGRQVDEAITATGPPLVR